VVEDQCRPHIFSLMRPVQASPNWGPHLRRVLLEALSSSWLPFSSWLGVSVQMAWKAIPAAWFALRPCRAIFKFVCRWSQEEAILLGKNREPSQVELPLRTYRSSFRSFRIVHNPYQGSAYLPSSSKEPSRPLLYSAYARSRSRLKLI